MIIDTNLLDQSLSLQTDICILGAGVAGIVLAHELLPFFNQITLIESGDSTFSTQTQSLYSPEVKPKLYPNPEISRLRMLGGSSNHWENGTEHFDPIDFVKRDWVDNSGWPIKYSDISNYYRKAEEYCGVGKSGYDLKVWKKKLNVKDLFSQSELIESGIQKDGVPPTRFFEAYGKGLSTSDHLTIYKNANITDLSYEKSTTRIKSITFKSFKLIQHKITANVFIMCFGGIENARMMLEFNEKYDNTLGNQGDNVGRYFMDHPTIRAAHLYPFDKSIFKLYQGHFVNGQFVGGNLKLSENALKENKTINMRLSLYKRTRLALSPGIASLHTIAKHADNLEITDDLGIHVKNILENADTITDSFSRKYFDYPLFDDSDNFGGFQVLAMMEQIPSRHNRVRLGSIKDVFGLRKIIIDWEVTQNNKEMAWKSLEVFAQSVGAEGIGRVRLFKEHDSRIWDSQLGFGHHHIGTTRMGYTQREGVVDSNQKVFGTENLYITGSSVFSTGGHARPTLTIVALTIRLAEHIKKRYLL